MNLFFDQAARKHLAKYQAGDWRAPYQMTDLEITELHRGPLPSTVNSAAFGAEFRAAYGRVCTEANLARTLKGNP